VRKRSSVLADVPSSDRPIGPFQKDGRPSGRPMAGHLLPEGEGEGALQAGGPPEPRAASRGKSVM